MTTSPREGPEQAGVEGWLGGVVREERDAELAREGWSRRFVGGPPRLEEVRALYESLGREVLLDPIRPGELDRRCGDCTLALALFRVVYTRRPE